MKGELELKESDPPSSYTYGELTMGSFKKILKAFVDAAPVGDQITINYVDIGSGSGKTVLHAAVSTRSGAATDLRSWRTESTCLTSSWRYVLRMELRRT